MWVAASKALTMVSKAGDVTYWGASYDTIMSEQMMIIVKEGVSRRLSQTCGVRPGIGNSNMAGVRIR